MTNPTIITITERYECNGKAVQRIASAQVSESLAKSTDLREALWNFVKEAKWERVEQDEQSQG
jgi:hypothetical protein